MKNPCIQGNKRLREFLMLFKQNLITLPHFWSYCCCFLLLTPLYPTLTVTSVVLHKISCHQSHFCKRKNPGFHKWYLYCSYSWSITAEFHELHISTSYMEIRDLFQVKILNVTLLLIVQKTGCLSTNTAEEKRLLVYPSTYSAFSSSGQKYLILKKMYILCA